jgi:zinc and cadmium transporter
VSPTNLLILYAFLIVCVSLAGGALPGLLRLGHRSLQFVLSAVAGVMLGVGLFHMLPHAIMLRADAAGSASAAADGHDHLIGHDLLDPIMLLMVVGFLALFLLERFFHFHHHEPEVEHATDHAHGAGCQHDHDHGHDHKPVQNGRGIGWMGALVGLGVHSVLEGVALGASVVVSSHGSSLAGLATFLVIILHKPFDAMTLATLMRRSGVAQRTRLLANVLLALLVPAGIGLFWVGAAGNDVTTLAAWALAFSAGMFVCIASSDLLPELQFHSHDRVGLSLALCAGLAFAFVLGRLEAGSHVHVDSGAVQHDHHEHDDGHSH